MREERHEAGKERKVKLDLTRPRKGSPPGTIDLTKPALIQVGVERGWIYHVSSSVLETSKHRSSLTFSNLADSTVTDLVLHHRFSFHKLPHKDGEKADVARHLSSMQRMACS